MVPDPTGPKLLPLSLQPLGGDVYAHVFENARTGISRSLFWNLNVDFEPVTMEGEEWDCSFAADWLTWPVRTWRELDGMDLGRVALPAMIEPSLYLLAEHHPAALDHLQVGARQGSSFEVAVEASAQVRIGSGQRSVPISFAARLRFAGIIVANNNLQPRPISSADAEAVAAQFIRLDGLREPRSEGWRYVFEPET